MSHVEFSPQSPHELLISAGYHMRLYSRQSAKDTDFIFFNRTLVQNVCHGNDFSDRRASYHFKADKLEDKLVFVALLHTNYTTRIHSNALLF